jgi:hypothetical protein
LRRGKPVCVVAAFVRSDVIAIHDVQTARRQAIERLPALMLWAWERREDLNFIDPDTTGVAFLAGTIFLRDDAVAIRPRFQPLIVPPTARLVAVIRIQVIHAHPARLSPDQRLRSLRAIEHLARGNIAAIQIDFDATRSERGFYRDLLSDLRRDLPPNYAAVDHRDCVVVRLR